MILANIPGVNIMLPPDGGIIYGETNMHHLFPEPLNTITAIFFIAIAIYWLVRLYGFSAQFVFLSISAYVLLIGSIGGTVYHGLRLYPFFILMDWIPILLLCMMASAYLWAQILHRWLNAAIVILLFFISQFFIRLYMEKHNHLDWGISINYALMALMIIIPVTVNLFRTSFNNSKLVYSSIICFALALFFRVSDQWQLLTVGTHFLWHALGAAATHLMFLYLYYVEKNAGSMKLQYARPL